MYANTGAILNIFAGCFSHWWFLYGTTSQRTRL